MDQTELLQKRLYRQCLTAPMETEDAVRRLIGMQAQYFGNALHAVRIRTVDKPDVLPDTLVKTWTLRGTLHLHARADLPLLLHAGTGTAFGQIPFRTEEIPENRKQQFTALVTALVERGEGARTALRSACLNAGMTPREDEILFHPWGGLPRALAEQGKIAYAPDGERRFAPLAPFTPLDAETARRRLLTRYLRGYAPATVRDMSYFFGWQQAEIRRILANIDKVETVCDGTAYYEPEDGLAAVPETPACLFLAGFDPLLLGYQKADNPILPEEHLRKVFNLAGIVFPSVLLHGKVAGTWKRTGRTLRISLFRKPGQRDRRLVEESAQACFETRIQKLTIEPEL